MITNLNINSYNGVFDTLAEANSKADPGDPGIKIIYDMNSPALSGEAVVIFSPNGELKSVAF